MQAGRQTGRQAGTLAMVYIDRQASRHVPRQGCQLKTVIVRR